MPAPTGVPLPALEAPPGMALFVLVNYSGVQWNVNFANYLLVVPPRAESEEYTVASLAIEPGVYIWQGHSPDGRRITNPDTGANEFQFTIAAGEVRVEVIP